MKKFTNMKIQNFEFPDKCPESCAYKGSFYENGQK